MGVIKGRDKPVGGHLLKLAEYLGGSRHCARGMGHTDEKGTSGAPRYGVGVGQIILMLGNEGFAKGMCALLWDPQEVRIRVGSSSSSRPDPLDPTWPTHCWESPLSYVPSFSSAGSFPSVH